MREYGQVQCAFWGHPDIAGLSNEAKLLALYLLTGPHSNGLGCYRLPAGYITEDLGLDAETVSKRFAELSEGGFMRRCERTRHVFMPAFLRWNPVANENVAKARIKEFEEVPSQFEHIQELASAMLRLVAHWPEPFRNRLETLSQTVTETPSKQDPTRPDPNPTPPEKVAPAPAGAGRATRTPPHTIPDDWWPNATNLRWLQQAGVSDTDQVVIIDEFKRWAANSGLTRANWDLAFGRNPAVKSAVGRARTNGGSAPAGTNGSDPWSTLTRHVKDGHRLSDVEADDPALAATVQELGGMRRLRDMTERDFAFLERKFRQMYRRMSGG